MKEVPITPYQVPLGEWRTLGVRVETPLREVMRTIDAGRRGIAFVVDGADHLLGTVTDGDLRRAILRGVQLDAPAELVMNCHFSAIGPEFTLFGILELMRRRSIKQVPVVNSSGVILGLYDLMDLADLLEPTTRSNWALIMAGGKGWRLRPLTETIPKPMLPIGDSPLLEILVMLLVQHGFRHILISIHYLGEQIQEYFGDGSRFGCQIQYLHETQPLGTAGALSLLPDKPSDPVLVLNGDLLTDVDLAALMDYHHASGCAATQCVREYVVQIPFGVVHCENDQVVEIEEKPLQRHLINAGIYVLSPSLVDIVVPNEPCSMPDLLERARAQGHLIAAFPIRERWTDIGHLEDYHQVRDTWQGQEDR